MLKTDKRQRNYAYAYELSDTAYMRIFVHTLIHSHTDIPKHTHTLTHTHTHTHSHPHTHTHTHMLRTHERNPSICLHTLLRIQKYAIRKHIQNINTYI